MQDGLSLESDIRDAVQHEIPYDNIRCGSWLFTWHYSIGL